MNQIHIITDAGSDIVNPDRADLTILPMTIRFGDEEFQDGVNPVSYTHLRARSLAPFTIKSTPLAMPHTAVTTPTAIFSAPLPPISL